MITLQQNPVISFLKRFTVLAFFLMTGSIAVCAKKPVKLTGSTYTFAEMGGLCSTILHFVNDSLFSCNRGCEGPGHTWYGTYHVTSDTLFLEHGMRDTSLAILGIDSIKSQGTGKIRLQFIDQAGNNITAHFRARFFRSNDRRYGFDYDSLNQTLTANNLEVLRVNVATLAMMGLPSELQTDFSQGITFIYHLQIPQPFYAFLNKDIAPRDREVMLLSAGKLIPVSNEQNPFSNEPVIYKKNE